MSELSINDSQVSDLITSPDETFVLDDVKVTLVAGKSDVLKDEDLDDFIQALDEHTLNIATVIDDVEKVHSYEGLAKTVLAQERICQADAIRIDQTLGNWLNAGHTLIQEFTETPSATNLAAAKDAVVTAVSDKTQAAIFHYEKALASQAELFQGLLPYLLNTGLPAIVKSFKQLRYKAQKDISRYIGCKNFYVFRIVKSTTNGAETNEISQEAKDLRRLNFSGNSNMFNAANAVGVSKHMNISSLVDSYYALVGGNTRFRQLLTGSASSQEPMDIFVSMANYNQAAGSERQDAHEPNNYIKLLEQLASGRYEYFFSRLLESIAVSLEPNGHAEKALAQLKAEYDSADTDTARQDAIQSGLKIMTTSSAAVTLIYGYLSAAIQFVAFAEPIIDAFSAAIDEEEAQQKIA